MLCSILTFKKERNMLVYNTSVEEAITHVYDVLASQVCRQMIQELGLTSLFENKIYINSFVRGPSKSHDHSTKRPILNESNFKCDIKYNVNPFSLKWDSTIPGQHLDPMHHRRDTLNVKPLLYHPDANVQVIERYIPCNLELSCSMTFLDRVKAMDVMTRLATRYAKGELIMVNNLMYNYKLPHDVLVRLKALSSILGVENVDFINWLKQFSDNQIGVVFSRRQKNRTKEIVVKKNIFEALSSVAYDHNQPTTKSRGTSSETNSIEFNVVVQFARINLVYLKYPIIVNNTFVPEELVATNLRNSTGPILHKLKHPYLRVDAFRRTQLMSTKQPVRNPWYDDWTIPRGSLEYQYNYNPFFIGAFTFDNPEDEDGYTEIDLNDLDMYALVPKVLEYYTTQPERAISEYGPYRLSVYQGDTLVTPSFLSMENGILKIPNSLAQNKEHRVVLSRGTRDRGIDPMFTVMDCIILIERS